MQRIRGVWKARLILAMTDAPGRFNALQRATGIPQHHLCGVLRRLINRGFLVKFEFGPRNTSYELTDAGRELIPEAHAILAAAAALREQRESEEAARAA